VLANIETATAAPHRAVRKNHMVRTLAVFEWCYNHHADLAGAETCPNPNWYIKDADYSALSEKLLTSRFG